MTTTTHFERELRFEFFNPLYPSAHTYAMNDVQHASRVVIDVDIYAKCDEQSMHQASRIVSTGAELNAHTQKRGKKTHTYILKKRQLKCRVLTRAAGVMVVGTPVWDRERTGRGANTATRRYAFCDVRRDRRKRNAHATDTRRAYASCILSSHVERERKVTHCTYVKTDKL